MKTKLILCLCMFLFVGMSNTLAETVLVNVPDGGTVGYDSDTDRVYVQKKNGEYIVFDGDANDGEAFNEVVDGIENGKTVIPDVDKNSTISKGKDTTEKKSLWQKIKNLFRRGGGNKIIDDCDPNDMEDWMRGSGPWGPIITIPAAGSPRPLRGPEDIRRMRS